jgi:hypothetical protein
MEAIKEWATGEIVKLMPSGILDRDSISQMVDNLLSLDSASINEQISSLMDFTKKSVQEFIQEFIKRIEFQRKRENDSKAVERKTNKAAKQAGGTNKVMRKVN